ncbi:sensor histidine kinase [Flavobacterium subsaxonicum]|uniref:histidine kinase n=1 Tax=Flavobacterium subsaxonicum WB 4.1-42 = DSM 21790 TaxID=1121898 RepID=A0A0A2MGP8_9FLAO|nr:HAMP domain-containing sensor histidine kinase [Flavobacterium subsaxonicum]KGO91847.1 histidine kinase [Flavobacterium subsaxonicum WB 4.1-42 = DSM 21790]
MKALQLYQQLFIRLLLILLAVGGSFLLYQKALYYTTVFSLLVFVLLLAELFSFVRSTFLFYDKTISAILNNDFSADFSRHTSLENYKSLFKLYNHLKVKQDDQVSKDMVYRSILNNIETGVLILEKTETDWDVFLMNDYFSDHFQTPKVSKWVYLKKQLPSLCELIESRNFDDLKTSAQISIDGQDTQTFLLQASKTKTYNKEYYIVLLDSIQKVIEKKEKDAWINLMKVISHELLNSITPIRSLAQNLEDIMQQDALSKDDLEDIRQSVSTMINRSDHLQNFIESYRKLAMLPSPDKQKTELTDLLDGALNIMAPLFKKANITVTNTIAIKRWLMVDRLQMEQVLINLLINSMYALQDKDHKHIEISAEVKSNRVFISITDTGNGIEKEIEDKIFLPFFTTRKEGAGIGLTLSKNIVEAHGGYLSFKSADNTTKFIICLVE